MPKVFKKLSCFWSSIGTVDQVKGVQKRLQISREMLALFSRFKKSTRFIQLQRSPKVLLENGRKPAGVLLLARRWHGGRDCISDCPGAAA